MPNVSEKHSWLDHPINSIFPALTREFVIFLLICTLLFISRLDSLGARVMSHDENLHVYFSWLYSIGKGYQHTPLMHGPLQFHLLALTYNLLGANDFTARLPHAIASILTVLLLWKWRRYLGRAGTLVAAGLTLISPFMLYYGRYARNEAFIGLFFVLMLYSILRYLESGKKRYLFLLTIASVLHFITKETAFIYTAQALIFLAIFLINRITRTSWKYQPIRNYFLIVFYFGILIACTALGVTLFKRVPILSDPSQTAAPIIPGQIAEASTSLFRQLSFSSILLIIAGCAFLLAVLLLIFGYGWNNLCQERSFDMLILLGTFVLPQLTAFPVKALGGNPLDYQFSWPGWNFSALWSQAPVRTGTVFVLLCVVSIVIGCLWNKKWWFAYAALFWGIYTFFYTSIFTNWQGFFTGSVGSLGYWLQQQGVHRGDQPWYYYLLIQIPLYEFLPALGVFLAALFGFRRKSPIPLPAFMITNHNTAYFKTNAPEISTTAAVGQRSPDEGNFTFQLLLWWTLSSLLAFSMAGEKMPWLTFHISLPMILLTGWGLGQVIERLNWQYFHKHHGGLILILFVILILSFTGVLIASLGTHPPFQGKSLEQLSDTGLFLLSVIISFLSAGWLFFLSSKWQNRDVLRIAVLAVFTLLAIMTGRTAFRSTFLFPNDATEYLVYAHGASGIKDIMDQINEISNQISGDNNLQVAYDNNSPNQGVSWSFKWYLRNFPNAVPFDKPSGSLRDNPVIIVDQQNFDNIKPIVGDNYYRLDYIRMVWPNQDYFALDWLRIKDVLETPALRAAIFQIWLNRDYFEYALATGKSGLSLSDWQPSAKMQFFIRKDIAAQIWEYGIFKADPQKVDPYEKGFTTLPSDLVFGSAGNGQGLFNAPRGLTIGPDGSLYVADSRNNRIQHISSTGTFLQLFGTTSPGCPYSTTPPNIVPIGTFCEPWDVAVSPDGQWIYVADTWNHRIQKFTIGGKPVMTWGKPNYDPISTGPFGLWGPRGIAVDSKGNVLVADTGNKRIVIYDSNGNFISQLGGGGVNPGQFDEPVGLITDPQGNLYVADTWNRRIQVFGPNTDKTVYSASVQWDIAGWYSQTVDNKPYLAVNQNHHLFVTDPDSFRIIEFTTSGDFVRTWGTYGNGQDNFGLPSGIVIDDLGRVWVSDAGNHRLMRFTFPTSIVHIP